MISCHYLFDCSTFTQFQTFAFWAMHSQFPNNKQCQKTENRKRESAGLTRILHITTMGAPVVPTIQLPWKNHGCCGCSVVKKVKVSHIHLETASCLNELKHGCSLQNWNGGDLYPHLVFQWFGFRTMSVLTTLSTWCQRWGAWVGECVTCRVSVRWTGTASRWWCHRPYPCCRPWWRFLLLVLGLLLPPQSMWLYLIFHRLVGIVVKASASRAEDPRFESCLRQDFFGVESYQWLKIWHSNGYPARRLAI